MIRQEAGADTLPAADPGTPTPNVAADRETERKAARHVIVPPGHGPMGYAIPGAIGAAMAFLGGGGDAHRRRQLRVFCGELETAVRLQLPIVHVQFTNGSMGWIKMLQHLYMGKRYFGVDSGSIDAVAVARGWD